MPRLIVGSIVIACVLIAGCRLGAQQVAPKDPEGTGGLAPTQPDRAAGRIGMRPGVDLTTYTALLVARFPVTDRDARGKDDLHLARTIPPALQAELVVRLRAAKLFARVDRLHEARPALPEEKVLRLEGRITRLAAGDDTHFLVPGSVFLRLADRLKVQMETALVDVQSGQVVVVTADRRESPNTGDKSATIYVSESFEAMARDLVEFFERLHRGRASTPR